MKFTYCTQKCILADVAHQKVLLCLCIAAYVVELYRYYNVQLLTELQGCKHCCKTTDLDHP